MLSDEYDSDEEASASARGEKPGNAQFLETPKVQQQIDFTLVKEEDMFGKKKEVYRMKLEKMSFVDCKLCQLLFDYTKTCQHFSQLNQNDIEDLKKMMPGISTHRDIN